MQKGCITGVRDLWRHVGVSRSQWKAYGFASIIVARLRMFDVV